MERISLGQVVSALVDAEKATEAEIDSGLTAADKDNAPITKDGKRVDKNGKEMTPERAQNADDAAEAAHKQAEALGLANKFAAQQKLDQAIETAVSNATKNEGDMWNKAANGI
jgi:hypothetical protein